MPRNRRPREGYSIGDDQRSQIIRQSPAPWKQPRSRSSPAVSAPRRTTSPKDLRRYFHSEIRYDETVAAHVRRCSQPAASEFNEPEPLAGPRPGVLHRSLQRLRHRSRHVARNATDTSSSSLLGVPSETESISYPRTVMPRLSAHFRCGRSFTASMITAGLPNRCLPNASRVGRMPSRPISSWPICPIREPCGCVCRSYEVEGERRPGDRPPVRSPAQADPRILHRIRNRLDPGARPRHPHRTRADPRHGRKPAREASSPRASPPCPGLALLPLRRGRLQQRSESRHPGCRCRRHRPLRRRE